MGVYIRFSGNIQPDPLVTSCFQCGELLATSQAAEKSREVALDECDENGNEILYETGIVRYQCNACWREEFKKTYDVSDAELDRLLTLPLDQIE